MARKRSIETINKELDRLENREKSLQTDIDSVKSEKEKLLSARNEILEMEQRKTVNKIAEIVYEYFIFIFANISFIFVNAFLKFLQILFSVLFYYYIGN